MTEAAGQAASRSELVPDTDAESGPAALAAQLVVEHVGIQVAPLGEEVVIAEPKITAPDSGNAVGFDDSLHRGCHEFSIAVGRGHPNLHRIGLDAVPAVSRAVVLNKRFEEVEVVGDGSGQCGLSPALRKKAGARARALDREGRAPGRLVVQQHGNGIVAGVGPSHFPQAVDEAARQAVDLGSVVADRIAPAGVRREIAAIGWSPEYVEQRGELGRAAKGVEERGSEEHRVGQPASAYLAHFAFQANVGITSEQRIARGTSAGAGIREKVGLDPEVDRQVVAEVFTAGKAPKGRRHATALDAEHGFRVAAGLAAAKEGVDGAVKLGAGGMRRPLGPQEYRE